MAAEPTGEWVELTAYTGTFNRPSSLITPLFFYILSATIPHKFIFLKIRRKL
jgi:hypothetical protein